MNDTIFESWLYELESDSLDFKRDQYKFAGATNEEKSELLKDIIAMANSWSKNKKFIVIGIKESSEKPNNLVGVNDHIDDAALQEFVNSKVSGICKFEYKSFTKDERTYGIIQILVQERPVFLTKDYGKLKGGTVYVRRGSSTVIAKPDEISKMGRELVDFNSASLETGFFDNQKGKIFGNTAVFKTTYLNLVDEIPDYTKINNKYTSMVVNAPNRNYYRELVDFVNFENSYIPIHFAVKNIGDMEAVNLRSEIEFFSGEIDVKLDGEEIHEPFTDNISAVTSIQTFSSKYNSCKMENLWILYNGFDRLHAKRLLVLDGIIYLHVSKSQTIKGKITIFFDGLISPYKQNFTVDINCNNIELKWKDFEKKMF